MSKYTPGPWRAAPSGQIVAVNSSKQICRVWNTRNRDQDQSNASLIAAAPDLLEAIEAALAELDLFGWTRHPKGEDGARDFNVVRSHAKSAIAKARGEA